ncbi:MAG: hypothetical protein JNK23_04335 [Opitutaceae bacterium]|nr:hypothetical protein [Opitutaceae bacterium]
MALKDHPTTKPTAPLSPERAWGVLADEDEAALAVRFVVGERSVSFPVHTLKRWELNPGATDTLAIQADAERIVVQGHGLASVRDALDAGALRVLRVKPGRTTVAAAPGETVVTGIAFTVASE